MAKQSIDYVEIGDDPCGPSPDKREQWQDDREYVVLEMRGYRDGTDSPVTSLCDIDFYRYRIDGEGGDWIRGTFRSVSEIPAHCTHLREIARNMGLSS